MSESNQTDHWGLLASSLGAELQKDEPIEAQAPEKEESPQDAKQDAKEELREKREISILNELVAGEAQIAQSLPSKSNWDALAAEFGIASGAEQASLSPAAEELNNSLVVEEEAELSSQPEEFSQDPEAKGEQQASFSETSKPSPPHSPREPREKKSHRRKRRHRKDRDRSVLDQETKRLPELEIEPTSGGDSSLADTDLQSKERPSSEQRGSNSNMLRGKIRK